MIDEQHKNPRPIAALIESLAWWINTGYFNETWSYYYPDINENDITEDIDLRDKSYILRRGESVNELDID